jgi:pyrrolidone-carboxylate peptidase
LLAHIPRCIPTQTIEEERVPAAIQAGVTTQTSLLQPLLRGLTRTGSLQGARRVVLRLGQQLWTEATSRAQNITPDTDDRILYWARLQMVQAIRQAEPGWLRRLNPDRSRRARQELINTFERASRGIESATFQGDTDVKRILISGFDPFGFAAGGSLHQGNPSGAAVLALDGTSLQAGGIRGEVQAVIFPVRFTDFESGIVERFFAPHLSAPRPPDLIMTISMGQSNVTELEMFAGRRRSTEYPDNVGIQGGGTAISPQEIPGVGPGPEFLGTNVPPATLEAMRRALGRQHSLPGETTVREIPRGRTAARESTTGPTVGSTAVAGSGGAYLSNEIYYRTSLLRRQTDVSVPLIHLHTPRLPANANDAQRNAIIATIRRLLEVTLANL